MTLNYLGGFERLGSPCLGAPTHQSLDLVQRLNLLPMALLITPGCLAEVQEVPAVVPQQWSPLGQCQWRMQMMEVVRYEYQLLNVVWSASNHRAGGCHWAQISTGHSVVWGLSLL